MPGLYNRYTRKPLPLKSTKAQSTLRALALESSLTLVYVNESTENIDCLFVLSLPENSLISDFGCRVGRSPTELKLLLAEKLEPDYLFECDEISEASVLQRGDFLVDHHQNQQYFTGNIGCVGPNEDVSVKIDLSTQCDVTKDGAVRFFLPSVCTPRYIHRHKMQVPIDIENTLSFFLNPTQETESSEASSRIPNLSNLAQKTELNLMPYTFEFALHVKSPCLLSGVYSPTHEIRVDAELNETDARNCIITLDGRHEYSSDMEINIYLSQPNEAYSVVEPGNLTHSDYEAMALSRLEQKMRSREKDESGSFRRSGKTAWEIVKHSLHKDIMHVPVCMVSFTPDFESLMSHYDVKNIETFLCEYIFVVDKANSMSGAAIANLRETLLICLKSLPSSCLFNFVGYGSVFKRLFDHSKPFMADYVNEASKWIKAMRADMGALDLFAPLEWIFTLNTRPGVVRQVIVFTDGPVNNTHQVLELIRNNVHASRVFSVGVGMRADVELVRGLAIAGNGQHCCVTGDDRMQSKVLELLTSAMQPVLSDIKIEWNLPSHFEVLQSPQELPPCFKSATITAFAFIYPRFSLPSDEQPDNLWTSGRTTSRLKDNQTTPNFFSMGTMDSDQSISVEGWGLNASDSRQTSLEKNSSPEQEQRVGGTGGVSCSSQMRRQLEYRHTKHTSSTVDANQKHLVNLTWSSLANEAGQGSRAILGNYNYNYTYRRVGRAVNRGRGSSSAGGGGRSGSHEGSRDSRDDDSGYGQEIVRQSSKTSSTGSFKYENERRRSSSDSRSRRSRNQMRSSQQENLLYEIGTLAAAVGGQPRSNRRGRMFPFGEQSSSEMSGETEDTFDRVETWANTGYPVECRQPCSSSPRATCSSSTTRGAHHMIARGRGRRSSQSNTNSSSATSTEDTHFEVKNAQNTCGTEKSAGGGNLSGVTLTVPFQKQQVPHLSIKATFAGKPFVRHVPLDLSTLQPQSSCSASSLASSSTDGVAKGQIQGQAQVKVVHRLAAKSVMRDLERRALRELVRSADSSKRCRNVRASDIGKRWKRKLSELSRCTGVISNYTEHRIIQYPLKLVMPRHIYVLAPPNRLVSELSRRRHRQRHSGWNSADSQLHSQLTQLRASSSDLFNDGSSANGKDGSWFAAEVLYAQRSDQFKLGTPVSDLLHFEKQVAVNDDLKLGSSGGSGALSLFMNARILGRVQQWVARRSRRRNSAKHRRHHLLLMASCSDSFSLENTCMQLLVNEMQPEGFWRLDEGFAEALDLTLEDLVRASPIVALPIPKECNCAKDITIMVEDLTESPPPECRIPQHQHRVPISFPTCISMSKGARTKVHRNSGSRHLVRQVKVGEATGQGGGQMSNMMSLGAAGDSAYELDDIHYVSESDNNVEEEGNMIPDTIEEEAEEVVTSGKSQNGSGSGGGSATLEQYLSVLSCHRVRPLPCPKLGGTISSSCDEQKQMLNVPAGGVSLATNQIEDAPQQNALPGVLIMEPPVVVSVQQSSSTSTEIGQSETTGSHMEQMGTTSSRSGSLTTNTDFNSVKVECPSSSEFWAPLGVSSLGVVGVPLLETQIDENLLSVGNVRVKKKRTLKSGKDRAVDYEDEVAAETQVEIEIEQQEGSFESARRGSDDRYCSSTMQPSSLFLTVPSDGGHRRSSYDEQAFRERQKILNRDYLKATDPDYYRRAGSVDHTCYEKDEMNAGSPPSLPAPPTQTRKSLPRPLADEDESKTQTGGHVSEGRCSRHYHYSGWPGRDKNGDHLFRSNTTGGNDAGDKKRKRTIKKAQPRPASGARRLSYHTVSKCSTEEVLVMDYFSTPLDEDYFLSRSKPDTAENRVWATSLALVFLQYRCHHLQSEWSLIAEKAERWITNQKLPRGFTMQEINTSAYQVLTLLNSNK